MDLKHTPGPWTCEAEKTGFVIRGAAGSLRSLEPSTGVIAVVPFSRVHGAYRRKAVDKCNAYLLAAALEMYEALEAADEALRRAQWIGPERARIAAALAKAAGRGA